MQYLQYMWYILCWSSTPEKISLICFFTLQAESKAGLSSDMADREAAAAAGGGGAAGAAAPDGCTRWRMRWLR